MPSVDYKKNILLTLGYSAQFSHALSASLLFKRLLCLGTQYSFFDGFSLSDCCKNTKLRYKLLDYSTFIGSLVDLFLQGKISRDLRGGSYVYSLKKTTSFDFSLATVQKKTGEIASLVAFISYIPWISALVLTGSVAAGTVRAKDDVDFMVITRPNRLWLVRPILLLFAWAKGKRRSWHSEEPNSWCFNLWLEETDLALSKNRWTVYTAYEVCQAKFVYLSSARELLLQGLLNRSGSKAKKSNCELVFLSKNSWVAQRLPHFFASNFAKAVHSYKNQTNSLSLSKKMLVLLDFLFEPLLIFLNLLAFSLQYLYMYRHMTTEEVTLKSAFFHPRNTKKQLYLGWKKQLHTL